ncbi:MAG: 6,7-dimethyl-8-ribityllumazine synthase [Rhodothermales bacterium]|nr:6,7-dimethyl-8-ribityllumazine synthase [Rhodothermales bacterium]
MPDTTPTTFSGDMNASGHRIAIVASRWNDYMVTRLVEGARETLLRHGAAGDDIDLAWVPGAFELPVTARRLAASGCYDAVVCLGAVIRGATPHFDYVAGEAAGGIGRVALETGVPVLFGVITTDTIEQAIERSGSKAGNKGVEAASAAIEMVNLFRQIDERT